MEDLGVRAGVTIPGAELRERFSRASGPGGQNVNRRDTRVEIVFDLAATRALNAAQVRLARARLGSRVDARGRVRASSSTARTQGENRRLARERLAALLADALRPPARPRRPTTPSRGAHERRIAGKRVRARTKRMRRRPSDED